MNWSMPVFLGISGITPWFIWWHRLRGFPSFFQYEVLEQCHFSNHTNLSNIEYVDAKWYRAIVACRGMVEISISSRYHYRERVERRANTTLKSSLWSNYRLDGLSRGLRVLELLFPESLQTDFNVCLKNCGNRSFHWHASQGSWQLLPQR